MSERIDHAAEARERLHTAAPWLSSAGRSDLGQVANILAAQVSAMLALVEQQRVANLIALGILVEDEVPETGERGLLYRLPDDVQSCPDIAAALGIGDNDE